jgi:hypothetical protein
MDNAARVRQRVLALFLPIAALLYISGEAVSPKGTDQVVTTAATAFKVLPIAARHSTQLDLASALTANVHRVRCHVAGGPALGPDSIL